MAGDKWSVQRIREIDAHHVLFSEIHRGMFENSSESYFFQFGAWKKEVNVRFSGDLPPHTIGIPANLEPHFSIPDQLPYEINTDGNRIHVGPVIAILVTNGKFSSELLNRYRNYFINYEALRGLIYLCSISGIRPQQKTVEGYCYNPDGSGSGQWVKSSFPYPDVAYRRTRVNKNRLYDHLLDHTGGKIFNSYFFNKWELQQSFSRDPSVGKHIPCTKRMDNFPTFEEMLNLYGAVYLKPVNGSMGKGIHKAQKADKGYLFTLRDKTKIMLDDRSRVSAFLRKIIREKKYLIQQAVDYTHDNKHVDFRVIMQKDRHMQWTCTGIVARYGKDGRIYTNDVSSVALGRTALQTVFGLQEEDAARKEQEIVSVCTEACRVIDKTYGVFGDAGFDVAVDRQLNVWILEINSRHNHSVASYAKEDPYMFGTVLARPLEYAKSLAGFFRS
ncbi:YheC/YheD family protein [Paenibacillus tarimensis]